MVWPPLRTCYVWLLDISSSATGSLLFPMSRGVLHLRVLLKASRHLVATLSELRMNGRELMADWLSKQLVRAFVNLVGLREYDA